MTPSQLIKIRIALGMTQPELAIAIGLADDHKHISAMENGHKKIMGMTEFAIKWIMYIELDHDTRMDLLRDIQLS